MHQYEAKILEALKKLKKITASELAKELQLNRDAVSRMAYSLSKKQLVTLEKLTTSKILLTEEGQGVIENGLPEKQFLENLPKQISDVSADMRLGMNWAVKRKWIELKNGVIVRVVQTPPVTEEERALKNINKLNAEELVLLRKRKWVTKKLLTDYEISITPKGQEKKIELHTTQVTPEMLLSGNFKDINFATFSPNQPVPEKWPGRFHPMTELIEKVRSIFLELGFTERSGPYIESAFWDFDALFVPQDHPVREMQDTFYIDGSTEVPKELADRVEKVHMDSWGNWNPKEATRRLLRTHTTCVSARALTELEPPAKIFSIGRVFRNETVDYKHLAEFHQVEGIVYDPNVTLRDLFGFLKHFFSKLGFDKIRIRPAFFPYTGISAEVDVWLESKNKWMELGGSGIFRSELVEPLTGKDCPVLAWGLGIERLAMMYYGLDDIRDLYNSDIDWLRKRRVFI
ncbi:MAG: phenylalanine--tRNA ligase subunit alpha [Candidatus Altiarchaeota archaeon]|nr:phenylalanine--tRNA ligase subunit alpha [Candidatus Altiarchaeota archaeon]